SSSVIATTALVACESGDARNELLAELAAGERTATLAVAESEGDWSSAAEVATAASGEPGDLRVDGEKLLVLDPAIADVLLVSARDVDGSLAIFAVERDADGVVVVMDESIDLTRRLGRIRLTGARATRLSTAGAAVVDEALAVAIAALGAEQLGAAEWCLTSAVGYANVREQFGRAIAEFQAVQHRCADILVEIELARTALL